MFRKGNFGKKTGAGFYKWIYRDKDLGNIKYRRLHDYSIISMERLEKLNALDEDMWRSLYVSIDEAAEDDVKCIIIKGGNGVFSAGDDISVMSRWGKIDEPENFFEEFVKPLIHRLATINKPVIMVVDGLAFGGGMELLLLGDIIVSTEDSTFSIPEVLIGALPPLASTLGILLLGRRIINYCITGDRLSSSEARELGIVDIVIDRENLDILLVELVDKIRRASPTAVSKLKNILNKYRLGMMPLLEYSLSELINVSMSKDFKEGTSAFIEKRYPIWDDDG
jgi:enoyl-CoA hydratase/carnithine racemase